MAAKMGFKPYYIDIETCKYRSDVGNGTGVNPIYLRDKKTVMNQIVKKSIKQIGLWGYLVSLLRFTLTTSVLVRRIYGILFRQDLVKSLLLGDVQ